MNANRLCVFLGPSLSRERAEALLPARYLPPAAAGDLRRVAAEGAQFIGLIDGRFDQRMAVGPREVLSVLKQGVRVYGAASMGALRAAELDRAGMIGVGRVYEWYRTGVLTAEDEVALAYDPETNQSVSFALVSVRSILDEAVRSQLLTPVIAARVLHEARQCHYAERSFELASRRAGLDNARTAALLHLAASGEADVKAQDAMKLLLRLAADAHSSQGR